MSFIKNYCDFNPRLFKEFTSMKTTIVPELSDDWIIENETYNTNDGIILYSQKLNQRVADINLRKFLNLLNGLNITLIGLKIQGEFIIGNDRALYSKDMYLEWKNKYDKRTETIISNNELKIGYKYSTPCGKEIIYAGAKYMVNLKETSIRNNFNFKDMTKPTLVHFVITKDWKNKFTVEKLKNKCNKEIGLAMNLEDINKAFDYYKIDEISNVYLENNKPSNNLSLQIVEKELSDSNYKCLFIRGVNDKLYCNDFFYKHIYVTTYSNNKASHLFGISEDLTTINKNDHYSGYNDCDKLKIKKAYLLKLK